MFKSPSTKLEILPLICGCQDLQGEGNPIIFRLRLSSNNTDLCIPKGVRFLLVAPLLHLSDIHLL